MEWKALQDPLYNDVLPVVQSMGYSLVELNRQQIRGRLQVRVVIHHYRGIGLKDCELVHKTILPRIELMEKNREVNLEVSSPGITRNIKYAEEFAIFIDRRARILTKDSEDWIGGTILGADEKAVELSTPEGKLTISISDIKKAKLAYSQEDE